MSLLGYDELRRDIPLLNNNLDADYRIEAMDLPGPIAIFSYAAANHFSILTLTRPPGLGGMCRIDIVGGGAHGAEASPALFEQLVTKATSDLQWGGPFGTIYNDGTVTFGMRTAISSGLLSPDNGGFSFIGGMIRVMGESARLLAQAIVVHDGGTVFSGADGDSPRLLAASRVAAAFMS